MLKCEYFDFIFDTHKYSAHRQVTNYLITNVNKTYPLLLSIYLHWFMLDFTE